MSTPAENDAAALQQRIAEHDDLGRQLADLEKKLGALPRADKAAAHDTRMEIQRVICHRRHLKPKIATLRGAVGAREQHHLWADAVAAVCGADALRDCYAWMKAEKKRRGSP